MRGKLDRRIHTLRTMEHKKEPIAISRPDMIGQRMRYSHINSKAGVITTCRKSEHGKIMDHSLKRDNVFKEGQQPFSADSKIILLDTSIKPSLDDIT